MRGSPRPRSSITVPSQRRDAAQNRIRLLDAARTVFAAQGADAPFDDIARAAGVSRTTLYRNFATREELATAVYEDNIQTHEQQARDLVGRPEGIYVLYNHVLESAAKHRGITRILVGSPTPLSSELTDRAIATFDLLLEDGRAAGVVRPDITVRDIMITFSMVDASMSTSDAVGASPDYERVARLLHRALFDMTVVASLIV